MGVGLTQVLAIYGAVTSTVALGHSMYVGWLDRRPRLGFSFQFENTTVDGQYTWCMKLVVMNTGRVTVMLQKVQFQFLEDGKRFQTWEHPRDLPHELPAGQNVEFDLRADEMARVIGNSQIDKSVTGATEGRIDLVPVVVDAVGRRTQGPTRAWPGHKIQEKLANLNPLGLS